MKISKIFIGGWFQRTTLHLSEIWDFLNEQKSELDIPNDKLKQAARNLNLKNVTRENGTLEYILAQTTNGVDFRIYEDGLTILEKESSGDSKDFEDIKKYYDERLSPAISLIFSKGAPVPKELANIKTILPYIVVSRDGAEDTIKKFFEGHGEEIYSAVSTQNVGVYKSPTFILINNLKKEELIRGIVESQIFFREFKTQLHRYLNIHRTIWEKIAAIKEQGAIKGTQIAPLRNELSDYQKTISLIDARIKQMGSYVRTRQKVTDIKQVDEYLNPLFQLKFETLQDTHEYINHLWGMTKSYLDSTIGMFNELQAQSTKTSLSSLQLITTIGVVSGIIGYLGKDKLPSFTGIGLIYFGILLVITWAINNAISALYKNKKYPVKSSDIIKNIK